MTDETERHESDLRPRPAQDSDDRPDTAPDDGSGPRRRRRRRTRDAGAVDGGESAARSPWPDDGPRERSDDVDVTHDDGGAPPRAGRGPADLETRGDDGDGARSSRRRRRKRRRGGGDPASFQPADPARRDRPRGERWEGSPKLGQGDRSAPAPNRGPSDRGARAPQADQRPRESYARDRAEPRDLAPRERSRPAERPDRGGERRGRRRGRGREREREPERDFRRPAPGGMPGPYLLPDRDKFTDLVSTDPDERIDLEIDPEGLSMRVVDIVTPIGKGQRGLIVAPPKTGKTTLLMELAQSITENHPEVELIVMLVDERPEEVTAFRRAGYGEVWASSNDEPNSRHLRLTAQVLEHVKRRVLEGKDVCVLLDSITRLARAHNVGSGGRTLSGGLDSRALERPKRFFGAARKVLDGGSLTILATALIDTGSRMDEVIFQEFKGTGNMELQLDRRLAERRIWPAIDIPKSGTRKEEKLFERDEWEGVVALRRALSGKPPAEAMTMLLNRLQKTKSNREFLLDCAKAAATL